MDNTKDRSIQYQVLLNQLSKKKEMKIGYQIF